MAEQKLFLRKATGLVREIGFTTAVIIVLAHTIGLGWQKRVFQALGWAPVQSSDFFLGINPMTMAFLLYGVVILLTVYCVSVMASAMPRSGGGYVFISRILHPGLGFTAAWLDMLSTAVSYGLIAVAIFEAIGIFGGIGFPALAFLGDMPPVGLFIGGVVIILLFSWIATLGVRQMGAFLQVIFWIPAAISTLR